MEVEKLLDLDLGLFFPINDIIYLRKSFTICGPEIPPAPDSSDPFQCLLIQINPLMDHASAEEGLDLERGRTLSPHTNGINLDTKRTDGLSGLLRG